MMNQQFDKSSQENVAQNANSALDQSISHLPPNVESRLQTARKIALTKQRKPAFKFNANMPSVVFNTRVLSTGLAFSFCLTLFWMINSQETSIKTPEIVQAGPQNNIEAFILLSSLDETELDIIEDLEFVYWLSENEEWLEIQSKTGGVDA